MAKQANGEWAFTDDLKDADWSRYAVYAPRIRDLFDSDWDPLMRLSILAVRSVLAHLPSDLQLPHPASVEFSAIGSRPTTLLELPIISQSLRKLVLFEGRCLEAYASPSFASSLQDASRVHHPCLEELELTCKSSNAALVDALNACLIKHGSRIARLEIETPFDERVWASIFSLSSLQTLYIAPFTEYGLGELEEIMPMIQALVGSQPQLKGLELDLALWGEPSQSNPPYSRIIRSLMGLQNLETLRLHISLPLSLTESEVQEMGASWPKMRILQFDDTSYMETGRGWAVVTPRSDLSLLPYFLREFPRLERLRIPFSCDKPVVAPQDGSPPSALRFLGVGTCGKPKASREQVVAYLAVALPHATQLIGWNQDYIDGHFWGEVARDLRDLRKAA